MRILLDTSYLYDLMAAPGKFSETERKFFEEHDAQLHVSAVSVWEMRLKYHSRRSSGERKSPHDPNDVIVMLEEQGMTFLHMTPDHAARKLEIPVSHKDPFDELLLVQAQEEGLKLLTVDRQLVGHPLAVTL